MEATHFQGAKSEARAFELIEEKEEKVKWCNKCGEWKLHSDFYSNVARRDGLCCQCKICDDLYRKIKRKRAKQRHEPHNQQTTPV